MNREDMIRMAHKAGWQYASGESGYEPLWRFAEFIAEQEFKRGFYAGWGESGEGFNSECGTTDNRVYEMCMEAWEERRKA